MKTKLDFVTNSSSSSFVISMEKITAKQFYMILNHIDIAKEKWPEFDAHSGDEWTITENETTVEGSTMMDNFDMSEFLTRIGVDSNDVKWED